MQPDSRSAFVVVIILALFGIGSALFGLNEARRNRVITTDSIVYIDTARHIAAGEGIRTSVLRLNDTEVEPQQTQYPPLYSILIAGTIKLGAEPIFAGRLVSAISFGLLVFFVGLWLWRMLGPFPGIAAAALLFTLPSLTGAAAAVWADLLYTLIVAIAVALGTRILLRPSRFRWFVLGSLVGIAIFTKYLGIILIGVAVMFLGLEYMRRKILQRTMIHSLLVIAGIALYVVPLLLRNVVVNRPIGGAQRFLSDQSITAILNDMWLTLAKDFTANWVWVALLILTAISIVVLVGSNFLRTHRGLAPPSDGVPLPGGKSPRYKIPPLLRRRHGGIGLILLTIAAYLIGLIITRWLIDTDPIHTRFLVPIYPLIAVVFISLINAASTTIHARMPTVILTILMLVSIGYAVKAYDFSSGTFQIKETSRVAWVRENTTHRDLLIGDHAPEYTLFLGRASIYLEASPTASKLKLENIELLRQRWSPHFDRMFFTLTPNLDAQEYGQYVSSLSRREIQSPIPSFVHQEGKLVVFQVL